MDLSFIFQGCSPRPKAVSLRDLQADVCFQVQPWQPHVAASGDASSPLQMSAVQEGLCPTVLAGRPCPQPQGHQAFCLQRVWHAVRQQVKLEPSRGRTRRRPRFWVQQMWQKVHSQILLGRSHENPHKGEAVLLSDMWKDCSNKVKLQLSPEDTYYKRARQFWSLRLKKRNSPPTRNIIFPSAVFQQVKLDLQGAQEIILRYDSYSRPRLLPDEQEDKCDKVNNSQLKTHIATMGYTYK